jgi:hypothetical protein
LKASVNYSDRTEIKIIAGVSSNTTDTEPEYTISFPYFAYQGGDNLGMEGTVDLLELGLDISPLLSYVDTGVPAKFFIGIDQKDAGGAGSGSIVSMSVIDNVSTEYTSTQSNINIVTNNITYMSVVTSVPFDAPIINSLSLPDAQPAVPYTEILAASNGLAPYNWDIIYDYTELENSNVYPTEAVTLISTSGDDDGFAILNLDFDFPFYGQLYDHITILTDGSIVFGDVFEYVRNEGDIIATKAITPYGTDLMSYPADGDGIYYYMDTDHLTLRWVTSMWDLPEVDLDFTVKIYANSDIEFFYGPVMTNDIVYGSGISNGSNANSEISSISNFFDPINMKTAFSTTDFPYGMTLTEDGIFSGTLDGSDNTWNVNFRVTDGNNISSIESIPFSLTSEPTDPPIPPNNNIITIIGTSVVLNWDIETGDTGYHIFRSEEPYANYVKIASVGTNTYTDTGILLTGEKHFYYITADNAK